MKQTYVLNQEYDLFKIDEEHYYIKGNVLYRKSIFPSIVRDTPHGKVIRQAEELKDICDGYFIDDGSLPLNKNKLFEKKDYQIFIAALRYNDKHGLSGGFYSGRGIVKTNDGFKFIGRVNKSGELE